MLQLGSARVLNDRVKYNYKTDISDRMPFHSDICKEQQGKNDPPQNLVFGHRL